MLTRFLPGLQTREDTLKRPELVLALLDEAYEKRTWHGPNLRQSIRGVTVKQAAWRPGRGRHNIWEVTVHAAYWKYVVRRRITGEKPGSFPRAGSNWFERPHGDPPAQSWEQDVRLLVEEHRRLRDTILALPARALDARIRGHDTAAFTIRGIAAHDL